MLALRVGHSWRDNWTALSGQLALSYHKWTTLWLTVWYVSRRPPFRGVKSVDFECGVVNLVLD